MCRLGCVNLRVGCPRCWFWDLILWDRDCSSSCIALVLSLSGTRVAASHFPLATSWATRHPLVTRLVYCTVAAILGRSSETWDHPGPLHLVHPGLRRLWETRKSQYLQAGESSWSKLRAMSPGTSSREVSSRRNHYNSAPPSLPLFSFFAGSVTGLALVSVGRNICERHSSAPLNPRPQASPRLLLFIVWCLPPLLIFNSCAREWLFVCFCWVFFWERERESYK